MRLIKMKTKMKMENRSHRYDKDRRKSRHEHKYGKYKKCLSMMMLLKYRIKTYNTKLRFFFKYSVKLGSPLACF